MDKRKGFSAIEFSRPLFMAIAFTLKITNKVFFEWWLDSWIQRKSNRKLLEDVQANFGTLVSEGKIVHSERPAILPFDGAEVKIVHKNITFCFTRIRSEISVVLAPSHVPIEAHELGMVIAALERRHLSGDDIVNTLADAARLLRPRLEALNYAFSEENYVEFRKAL